MLDMLQKCLIYLWNHLEHFQEILEWKDCKNMQGLWFVTFDFPSKKTVSSVSFGHTYDKYFLLHQAPDKQYNRYRALPHPHNVIE